eukprot:625178-Hanusia_phi.AAC.1
MTPTVSATREEQKETAKQDGRLGSYSVSLSLISCSLSGRAGGRTVTVAPCRRAGGPAGTDSWSGD